MYNKRAITYFILIITCLISRIAFLLLSGYDNFELFNDSFRYDMLSNRIIEGDFNMDVVAYIVAPLYPWTLALFKLLSEEYWITLAVIYQFGLVSISIIYLYKLALLIFKDTSTAVLASVIYIFYPLTLWYNHTLVQETSFQAFFIFFCYFFTKYIILNQKRNLVLAALFFAISLLTKSHIVILIPFLYVIFLVKRQYRSLAFFSLIVVICCLPFSITNYIKHNVVTLSSHGWTSLFLLGHSDIAYKCLTSTSGEIQEIHSEGCNADIVFDLDYNYGTLGFVNQLSPQNRSHLRFKYALEWIRANQIKYAELKWHGLKRFLIPGLDWKQYRLIYWLPAMIIGFLLYIPSYISLYLSLKDHDRMKHYLFVSVILSILLIYIFFFPMNRFRVITMDPLIIIYAASVFAPKFRVVTMKIRNKIFT
ncbi:MAG: glycosyltransferase family 39 protein [Bacteroidia bacterium]|nr:glycosyltransferase family 39 protein [Bacteroidia bacterium]